MNEEQIVQAVQEALAQGINPEEIVQGLVNEVGIPQDQAVQLVQAVMQQGGGQGGQGGGESGVTAEQAVEALSQLGVQPDVLLQIIDIIMNMTPEQLEKLIAMISKAGQGGGERGV